LDPEKLPEVADHYTKEILAIQPEGPLIIAGNCRGGRAAIRITKTLQEIGREVSHLCILEMFDRGLYDSNVKTLLLFGKQSNEFRYRDFHYGRSGWKLPFRNPPRVEWVEGRHARFFTPENVGTLAAKLRAFLDDTPEATSLASRADTHARLLIHRIPLAFNLYVRLTSRN
jgi:thioesterase domain-containing protein